MISRLLRTTVLGIGLAVLVASCATTKSEVDVTPTARVTVDAHVGKDPSPDGTKIGNISSEFGTTETVYAVVDVPGRLEGKTLRVRWLRGDQQVSEQSVPLTSEVHAYPFQLVPATSGHTTGEYVLEVFVNDDRVETEHFKIQ